MNDILAILSGGAADAQFLTDFFAGDIIAAVWKRIAQLREEGWQIEAAGRRGYRLIPGDSLDPIFWVNQLTTKYIGRSINHYEHTITSSNTLVKQMAVQGAPPFLQLGFQLLCSFQQLFRCDHSKSAPFHFIKSLPDPCQRQEPGGFSA